MHRHFNQPKKPSIANAVAAHIRAFYRLIILLIILLFIAMIGVGALCVAQEMDTCPNSSTALDWLVTFGIGHILTCVLIGLLVCITSIEQN